MDIYFLNGAPLPGTRVKSPPTNALYRNDGHWKFTDVTRPSGLGDTGYGLAMAVGDYDNDGDTDIIVGNDVFENFLFRNDGRGRFEEVSLAAGFAYTGNGDAIASMGVDCGDYDNDGWLDFYLTSYQDDLTVLYRNLGAGTFQDVTGQTGAGTGTWSRVTWGTTLADCSSWTKSTADGVIKATTARACTSAWAAGPKSTVSRSAGWAGVWIPSTTSPSTGSSPSRSVLPVANSNEGELYTEDA